MAQLRLLKSTGAILAGMVTGAVLSIITDMILEAAGVFPQPSEGLFDHWMLLLALIYRGVYTVLAGYVTARLAPNHPLKHAIILGSIAVVATILGSIANWDKSFAWYFAWYPIALILITLPCTWLGGKWAEKKKHEAPITE